MRSKQNTALFRLYFKAAITGIASRSAANRPAKDIAQHAAEVAEWAVKLDLLREEGDDDDET